MTGRQASRWIGALVAALLIAAFAFVFRFNPLGGTLGGFDNDHFVHLLRTDMLLNGEQPLRDFADSELRGAVPSLGYATSAWAQQIAGRSLLPEAYLTVGALALCAGAIFLLALHLTGRWWIALLVAACVIVAHPKLYNYEKVLVLLVGLSLVYVWVRHPSWPWLAAMSGWTAVAALFRHDFAVYVAAAAAVAILAHGSLSMRARALRLAGYAAIVVLLLVPSVLWVQRYAGVVSYVQRTLQAVTAESSRTQLGRPRIDLSAGWTAENLATLTYYAFWIVPMCGAAVVALIAVRNAPVDRAAPTVAFGLALLVCTVAVNTFFLRGNLLARFGDAVVPVVLLGAWTMATVRREGAMRTIGGVPSRPLAASASHALSILPGSAMLFMVAAMFVAGDMRTELAASGLLDSWEDTRKRYDLVRERLAALPPREWAGDMADGTLVGSYYLAECTEPTDRVLMATYAPEVPVFARRLFAAGQGTFGLAFYESEVQQREAVARLQGQSVPIVLGSFDDFEGEFVADYRHVHEWMDGRYEDAGVLSSNGTPRFRVFVASDREPRGLHPALGLPCFR